MNAQNDAHSDPLIDDVRQRRHALLSRHGNDLTHLLRTIRALQAQHPDKVVNLRGMRHPTTRKP